LGIETFFKMNINGRNLYTKNLGGPLDLLFALTPAEMQNAKLLRSAKYLCMSLWLIGISCTG